MQIEKLTATDNQISGLVSYAKTTSEGAHPTYGNYVADVLDHLNAVVWASDDEDKAAAAEALVDAATALRDRADEEMQEAA